MPSRTPSRAPSRAASRSSWGSGASAFSECSSAQVQGPPRRGHKRISQPQPSPSHRSGNAHHSPNADRKPTFQCTFCRKKLSEKSWKRHEESQHLPKQEWTCMPHETTSLFASQSSVDTQACAFCLRPLWSGRSHFCSSATQVAKCLSNPKTARTFQRRDHLARHIRCFHGFTPPSYVMDAWATVSKTEQSRWECGFCGENLEAWDLRATHIAAHFRQGMVMDDWGRATIKAKEENDQVKFVLPRLANKRSEIYHCDIANTEVVAIGCRTIAALGVQRGSLDLRRFWCTWASHVALGRAKLEKSHEVWI